MSTFNQSSMRELKINDGEFHLYLSKNRANQPADRKSSMTAVKQEVKAKQPVHQQQVKAPLVGTVYLQSKPQQPPYVHVGSHVQAGDTVCVIEAMKMMTEVKAKTSGIVKSVDVENGELVEVGQPLFTLTKEQ